MIKSHYQYKIAAVCNRMHYLVYRGIADTTDRGIGKSNQGWEMTQRVSKIFRDVSMVVYRVLMPYLGAEYCHLCRIIDGVYTV